MTLQKIERNKKMIKLRLKNPKKWSFAALGNEFNISRYTVYDIWENYVKRGTPNVSRK